MSFADEVEAFAAANPGVDVVEVLFSDIGGVWRGKQYPFKSLAKMGESGANFPLSALLLNAHGETPREVLEDPLGGDPDGVFFPVPGSLRIIPWEKRPTAQVIVRAHGPDGKPWLGDPARVLHQALEPFRLMELKPVVALEYEFYLVDASQDPPRPLTPPRGGVPFEGAQCYNMDVLYDAADFLDELEDVCEIQNIPITTILCEYGDGQFEANLQHVDDPVKACDDAMYLKRAVKALARKRGLVASYMAKPFSEGTGSGMHIHMSVLDRKGRNIFSGIEGEVALKHAIGGMLETMSEAMAFFAPNANSYRRLQPGAFAPWGPNWGVNHRSVAVRVPLSGDSDARFEHRVSGADACPYLALAAVLAGAHHGLSQRLDPGPAIATGRRGGAPPPMPLRWREALNALDDAQIIPDYLGEDFINLYLRAKRIEEQLFHAEVSDRDLGWYLRVI
ncbi:glutamine synthetase family protein [Neomegalonema perideroedes]|uniref:glutamine synthetase family protein n=1 Tax=Neomegalonema perideroedes TaxID=217219 RepID=UPI0003664C9A|nr:glutamine synthetase family protein [Neomegalonema perideroedes]